MRLGNLKHIPGVPVHAPSVIDFNNQNLTAFNTHQEWYSNRMCLSQTFMLSTPFYFLNNYNDPNVSPYNNSYKHQISNVNYFPMNITVQVSVPSIAFDYRPGLEKHNELYPERSITDDRVIRRAQLAHLREIYRLADPELGEELARRRDYKRWDTQNSSLMRVAFTDVDWDKSDDNALKECFKTTNVTFDESGDVTIKISAITIPHVLIQFYKDHTTRFLDNANTDAINRSVTFSKLKNQDKALDRLAGLFPGLPKLQAIVHNSLMTSCSLPENGTALVLHTSTIADLVRELQTEFKDTVLTKLKTQLESLGSDFNELLSYHGDHSINTKLQNAASSIDILLSKIGTGASFYSSRFQHEYSNLCDAPDTLYNDEYTRMIQGLFKLIELSTSLGNLGYTYNSLLSSFSTTHVSLQQILNRYKLCLARYTLSLDRNRTPEIEEQLQGLEYKLNDMISEFDNAEVVVRTYRAYIFTIAYMLQHLVHIQIDLINWYMIANYGGNLNLPEEVADKQHASLT